GLPVAHDYALLYTMESKLKIAVTAWSLNERNSAAQLAEQAEIAEQMGFHSFWLPESHFNGEASIPSPLMLLATVASRTTQIRLGSTSYLLPIRHPLQAAEEVAVLDSLSGGRVILGIGRGFQQAMFNAFQVPLKDKRKRFSDVLKTMIQAWSGEPVAWDTAADGSKKPVQLAPLPIQKPHPPIWVAAFGPLALRQAGTLGLPYLASPIETESTLAANYRRHKEHAVNAGHGAVETVPIMRMIFVSKDKKKIREVRERMEQQALGYNRRKAGDKLSDWALIGDPDHVSKGIARYRNRLGATHLIASGRIAAINAEDHIHSLRMLSDLVDDLN
ncbi:MAG: LLM class flavin-dependent oxidoreductase, partial [Gammaproteobacteria bacterium]|nr:LLM class flavin-dependent oxidoreductase [Gammaproteobacteria bacterium]